MSELGKSVFKAVIFVNDFFKDISKLVTTVEEKMNSNKLATLGDAASFWYHSRAYYAPTKWMPRYIARQYVAEAPENSKPDRKAPWFAFFIVYLTPKAIEEPAAVWGIGTQHEKEDLWAPLDKVALKNDGPDFLVTVPVVEWRSVEDIPEPLSSLKFQAKAIVELNNAQTVDEVIIQPLLEEIRELRE